MKRLQLLMLTLFAPLVLLAQAVTYPTHFTVAQDGTGDFKTIQEAVNAVRDLSQQQISIFIKKGTYHEKLVIPSWKTRISLIGEDKENTIITNSDYSGKENPQGKDAFGKPKFTTYTTYTVLVQGDDFIAQNLTIVNASGPVGQAVALHVEGDRCAVFNCRLLGNQDTLYAATEGSREFYKDCYIEGTTDFIFGEATAVFEHCTIKNLRNSFITAPATTPRQQFGFVFFNCTLTAADSVTKVLLGRPWRPYGKTVFINTDMTSPVSATGWDNWRNPENEKTAFFAEYKSTGKGASVQGRAAWSHQLTESEIKKYTVKNILGGNDNWDVSALK
ncbi:pectinesterase family protein [Mucilaginibacter sabulilitoris]|uniref:Pectinesterase n=1 Tax=Mucilaginibacter sabulilitoris TaxID=1173583 RepID=A0ABZ0TGS7_9SPHI|nr:pectinesterase family protein [Mucilaginibacter sabulilitoris]WPU92400.1 pectinesterase family protein [Mucilaginibacter sabulilitoris]